MSGIVGIYRRDGRPIDRAMVDRMLTLIAHRGTDGHGRWVEGPIALGHRLLFTTPESLRERQPLVDRAGKMVLTWDGRLDNRDELIRFLMPTGLDLGAKTDPDLVLAAYRFWGEACPTKLIGDFAFALWDKEARSLFCARDRLGLKPFHYAWDGQVFLFSSEVKPLIAALGAEPRPDDDMVLAFLLREFREADQHRTFWQDIRRLPPAHSLRLRDGHLNMTRYWAIDPTREIRYASDGEYADHFRSLFHEAVRCRLRSHFPIGAMVSGGLDSSSIVCAAETLSAETGETFPPIEAFTFFSDDPHSDERTHFAEVVKATGLKAHAVHTPHALDPLEGLDDVIRRTESPIIGIGHGHGRMLMEAMDSRGCRVLLSGDGGDQLLDGIGYLSDLLVAMKFWRFLADTRSMARWYGGVSWEFGMMACAIPVPPFLKYWGKRIVRGVPPSWMNAELARAVRLGTRIREPRHRLRFPSHGQSDTYLSVFNPYYTLKLEVDERDAAWCGKEMRYPFLDSRLAEFILSIPPALVTQRGIWKGLLRAAMQGVLPEPIRLRRGKGDWTTSGDDALTRLCRRDPPAPLQNVSGLMERYLNVKGARTLMQQYLRGRGDSRHEVWFFITLDRWLAWLGKGGRHE